MSASARSRLRLTRPGPSTIVDVLYTAGEGRAGYQIRAFLLGNDRAIREERGTKNADCRNVTEPKADKLVQPLAKQIFAPDLATKVSFAAYFDFLRAWNMAHGVVPDVVELPDGTTTTPSRRLMNRHTFLESVRSEAVALPNVVYLRKVGVLPERDLEGMIATYLTSLCDSLRLAEHSPQSVVKVIVYNDLVREWVSATTRKPSGWRSTPDPWKRRSPG